MKIDRWFEWPTNSSDAGVNFVIAIFLIILLAIAFAIGIVVVLPLGLAFIAGWWWYKHKRRGTPTDQMYMQTEQRVLAANFPTTEQYMDQYVARTIEAVYDHNPPAYSLALMIILVAESLYAAEKLGSPVPPMPTAGTIEDGRYRDELLAFQRKSADAPTTLEVFSTTLAEMQGRFFDHLPPMTRVKPAVFALADRAEHQCTFPLIDLIQTPAPIVADLVTPFFSERAKEIGLFSTLRKQLAANIDELPALDDFRGTPREMVRAYLQNTPLEDLFYADIPFEVPIKSRLEHTVVVAGSGHGKTQLLQSIIAQDLAKEDPPALIIIDSTGAMVKRIQELALFDPNGGRLADRLLIIDPEDDQSPALNMFDTANDRLKDYSRTKREQLEAEIIELFNYVFASIANELTGQQSTAFSYVVRLLLSIPGSTIHTLTELLEEEVDTISKSKFKGAIGKLDATAQAFFENQFYAKRFETTRKGIAARLYNIMRVPAFDRMFSGVNKLDMYDAMQTGKIVLVNTSVNLLKGEASALFGRFIIAKAIAAAFERVNIPENQRRPCFLIIDEASPYTDDNIETLLTKVRQFRLGVLLAYQHLEHKQITSTVKSALASSTTVKYAAALGYSDARYMSREMDTTPEFIKEQRKDSHDPPRWSRFACFVRNYTETALSISIPFLTLEKMPMMGADAVAAMLLQNRERISVGPVQEIVSEVQPLPPETPTHAPAVPREPDNMPDPSKPAEEW